MITVYSNGEVIGEYDNVTHGDLAIKVAKALMKAGNEVMVTDGDQYITEAGECVDHPHTWKSASTASRGRPKLPGRVVQVRMMEDDIARAAEIGHGDIAKGIAIALRS